MSFPRGIPKTLKKKAKNKNDSFIFNNLSSTRKRKIDQGETKTAKKRKVDINFARNLTWKSMKAGDVILGVVQEIQEMDLRINLPNMKSGFCSIREMSSVISELIDNYTNSEGEEDFNLPSLNSLVEVGQLFCFVILSNEKTKKNYQRVELTLREDIINKNLIFEDLVEGQILQVSIQSLQDKGYVISTGMEDVNGFYRKKKKTHGLGETLTLEIETIQHEQKMILFKEMSTETIDECKKINSIRPGQKVEVKIKKILTNGLLCKFSSCDIVSTVHMSHMNQDENYAEGDIIQARVLFASYATRVVTLTLLPHLVNEFKGFGFDQEVIKNGSFHYGECSQVQNNQLLLRLESGYFANCHSSQIADKVIESVDAESYLTKKFKCRVLSQNLLDGLLNVTMKPSILERKLYLFSDVEVGVVYDGTIVRVEERFALVEIAPHIRGTISLMLAGEVLLKDLTKKYKLNQKIRVMALALSPPKRIEFTDKIDIVKSDFTKIENYNITPHLITKGVVINVHPKGLKLLFFNKVFGYINRNELNNCGYLEDVKEMFRLGQVLQCRILGSDTESKNIFCTLRLEVEDKLQTELPEEGTTVKVKVVSMGKKTVQVYMKKGGTHIKGIIPFNLLSDFEKHRKMLKENLQSKQVLKAMILQLYPDYMVLTLKETLKKSVEKGIVPKSFDEIKVGEEYVGFVVSVDKVGVFVRFLGSLTGLATRTECVHLFGKEPSDLFYVGQTVRTKVVQVNKEKKRFYITLRYPRLQKKRAWLKSTWINSFFDETKLIKKIALKNEAKKIDGEEKNSSVNIQLKPGSTQTIIKQDSQPFGLLVNFENVPESLVGLALHPHHCTEKDINSELSTPRKCIVLDHNVTNKIVDVSLREDLMDYKQLETVGKKKVTGRVELVKDEYIVISVPKLKCFAFASVREPTLHLDPREVFKIGQEIQCRITGVHDSGRVLANLDLNGLLQNQPNEAMKNKKFNFFDANTQYFTDLKKGHCLFVQVATKIGDRIQASFGPSVPFKGVINKTRQVADIFGKVSVGDRIRVEIMSTPSSPTTEIIRLRIATDKMPKMNTGFEVTIKDVTIEGLYVLFESQSLFIPTLELSNNFNVIKDYVKCIKKNTISKKFAVGKKVQAIRVSKKTCSIRQAEEDNSEEKDYVICQVKEIQAGRGVYVIFPDNQTGFIHITNILQYFKSDPLRQFTDGDVLKACLIEKKSKMCTLSCRHISNKKEHEVTVADLSVGDRVQGFVKSVTKKGAFITLSRHLDAFCMLRNMVDGFVKDLSQHFPKGKLVSGLVTKIDQEKGRITVSLKRSAEKQTNVEDLKVGQNVQGVVNGIKDFGCFCTIKGTRISGLLHKSKIPKERNPPKDHFEKGENIWLQVSKIDKQKISFILAEGMELDDEIGQIEALNKMEISDDEEEQKEESSDEESEMEIDDVPELDLGSN